MNWKEQLLHLCKNSFLVTNQQVYSILPAEHLLKFEEHMRGKTCPILDNGDHGVYSWDLKQFLNKLK